MDIFSTIYNFFFKKKFGAEHVVPQDIPPILEDKKSVNVRSPIRKSMKWVEAKWIIMGENLDYKKTINP